MWFRSKQAGDIQRVLSGQIGPLIKAHQPSGTTADSSLEDCLPLTHDLHSSLQQRQQVVECTAGLSEHLCLIFTASCTKQNFACTLMWTLLLGRHWTRALPRTAHKWLSYQ